MKKWYVITGVLACLLVISVVASVILFTNVDELRTEVELQYEEGRLIGHNEGYNKGYERGLSTGREQGYDGGNYDGYWDGYDHGYEDGTEYGLYLAGEGSGYSRSGVAEEGWEWREYWIEQGIYDRNYGWCLPLD